MSSEQTVWVVTQGDYSDERIVGVCSSAEKAEQLRIFCDGNEPQKYTLDQVFPFLQSGRLLWSVYIQRDGNNARAYREDSTRNMDLANWRQAKPRWYNPGPFEHSEGMFHIWARDEQHAIKIANERRAQLIAEGLW